MNQTTEISKTVILIDDERAMRESISQWLKLADFEVDSYSSGIEAIDALNREFQGVVVTDLKMTNMDGMNVIEKTLAIDADIPVILITGHGDINSAVKVMQLGAYDFIEKPFEPDRLLSAIKRAMEKRHLVVQNRRLQRRVISAPSMQQRLIGESKVMQQLRKDIAEFAQIDINILITGETGTGKEVIAHCLHDFGKRSGESFHAIDCGSLPSDRLELDLFGSAGHDGHTGQLALANGGTLFLDEILNMPPAQQVKLLGVLESGEIRPVGGSLSSAIDVRVVSAANETLQEALKDELFRTDLYFRLNTIELHVPAVRDRGNDVIELFDHYASKAAQSFNRDLPRLSNHDITTLKTYRWPGNVREVKNIGNRFVLYQTKPVSDIVNEHIQPARRENLQDQVLAFEKAMIEFALSQNQGNVSAACEQLCMPRRTLNDKLIKHEIDRLRFT